MRAFSIVVAGLVLVGCGGAEPDDGGSTIETPPSQPVPEPDPEPTATGGFSPPERNPPPSGSGGGGSAPPPALPDDSACGGCVADARLRCDVATAQCVECREAADCAYGSQQECINGLCTNVTKAVTICPEQRVEDGESCGLSGYTCIWGTSGKFSCRCGNGAPLGGGVTEPTIWTCEVLP